MKIYCDKYRARNTVVHFRESRMRFIGQVILVVLKTVIITILNVIGILIILNLINVICWF